MSSRDPEARYKAIGAWLDSMPVQNTTTTYSGVQVDSNLQRQVIFSEAMRAFRRKLVPLSAFAHKWESVPLEGTDVVVVPYYPLFTTASQVMTTSGYLFGGTDVASQKNITVGGVPTDTRTAGRARAYQALTYSGYLMRRQPWVDILKLVVMRTEQLAIDVLNDVITANVLPSNFGNAVWSGAATAFDDTTVAALAGVASKAQWPEAMRSLVLGTDYWVNLISAPYLKQYLSSGTTDVLQEGKISRIYKFGEVIENALLPATSTNNLIGWISYPSAVGVATANILPPPGVMKLLVNYDQVTDDQIGLSFAYRYWGVPQADQDLEVIEISYGSNALETAALKRLTNGGA